MGKNEQKRIQLLDKARNDKNKVTVGFCVDIMCGTLSGIDKHTNTMKNIKKKLGEDDYVKLVTCIANSFISTLYINGAKNKKQMDERLKYVEEVNNDVIAFKEIMEEKK